MGDAAGNEFFHRQPAVKVARNDAEFVLFVARAQPAERFEFDGVVRGGIEQKAADKSVHAAADGDSHCQKLQLRFLPVALVERPFQKFGDVRPRRNKRAAPRFSAARALPETRCGAPAPRRERGRKSSGPAGAFRPFPHSRAPRGSNSAPRRHPDRCPEFCRRRRGLSFTLPRAAPQPT